MGNICEIFDKNITKYNNEVEINHYSHYIVNLSDISDNILIAYNRQLSSGLLVSGLLDEIH